MGNGSLLTGQWVRIHRVDLEPLDRAPGLPRDTARCRFESWINGRLLEEAAIGARARVQTAAGRVVEGELVDVLPGYTHSFGPPPSALQRAGEQARATVFSRNSR